MRVYLSFPRGLELTLCPDRRGRLRLSEDGRVGNRKRKSRGTGRDRSLYSISVGSPGFLTPTTECRGVTPRDLSIKVGSSGSESSRTPVV